MTKAEEMALKAYPSDIYSSGKSCRRAYKEGYEQAEKDVLKDARWIEIYDDTTMKMVDDFVRQNIDGAYRVIIVKR